jgi:hypothetical protein
MVYAIQLQVQGFTEAKATEGVALVQTKLNSKLGCEVPSASAFEVSGLSWGLVSLARYSTKSDRDFVLSDIQKWLKANVPAGATGELSVHDCTHDEKSPIECVSTVVWSK